MRADPPNSILIFGIALILLVFSHPGAAQAQEPITAEIFEFGIYAPGPITGAAPPSEYGVDRIYADHIMLTEATHEIPGRLNLSFGIRYIVSAGPDVAALPVNVVIRYPSQGLLNPERAGPSYADENTMMTPTDSETFVTWDFAEQWHIEPGIWTFEIWYGEQKLAEEWFEVITPPIS